MTVLMGRVFPGAAGGLQGIRDRPDARVDDLAVPAEGLDLEVVGREARQSAARARLRRLPLDETSEVERAGLGLEGSQERRVGDVALDRLAHFGDSLVREPR